MRRDFEAKAPTGTDILAKTESGGYASRFELLRDLALNLFWVNRYAMTMYEKRPMRWRDVPRRRDDVFLPILTPWKDGERKVAAVAECYEALPAAWDAETEDRIHDVLFDVYRNKLHHATELSAIKTDRRGGPRRARAASPTACRPTTPTSRSSATTRSSTAPRISPSSRR